ncbi:protocatechuate 3,4-dioxygenase subunit alpha [Mycobacterium lacus]|uniref:Protocatechuate 3,4-dioxygenase subunit alpha n=1 Tax=Mycobacterium lacus TaxID=169765 RepID=A0A1X1XM49_9MYCO|nr:protocatechuate 3,4-dioxygenase subunit alpha [Mycobacterium lacus]MCV7124456.1 protocatechuate 3,4-dioxygenase subunit alpha [Mycobacterium lacus]ORV99880.1 protocatechuate 3,4-dioxygenase subunit alpha [Mycobacterium lacus]BBX97278.1 protocatechuate 3,4-dioxygenase subunit alpha [Mycobacterium lacus]
MAELACTPEQTVGPFFGLGMAYPRDSELVGDAYPGAIRLHGMVYDGAGVGVPDALIELWQPDTAGRISRAVGSLRRDGWTFTGWGRAATDADGHYGFTTVIPGAVSAGRPPFFAITVFARGLLRGLFTRAYLPDGDLAADPLLSTVDPGRRDSLVCIAESASGRLRYRFDIHLQGPNETVFLAYEDDQR